MDKLMNQDPQADDKPVIYMEQNPDGTITERASWFTEQRLKDMQNGRQPEWTRKAMDILKEKGMDLKGDEFIPKASE